ncbi:MAG: toll/interleukin-1 receptor domain-containing protein [Devosia sp.]
MDGEGSAQVFISYSRKDSAAAERLRLSLIAEGFEAYLDKHDIAAGEEWRERLGRLIATADTMVFLVSPDSIASPICDWEVDHAELLGKRIIPVVCRSPEGVEVPARLRRLNYVFMRDATEEAAQLPRLSEAIKVDIAWVRTHTRYGEIALEWDQAMRPSRLLLRGASIREAEHWRDTRPSAAPALTEVQSTYVAASRRGASNRQRGWVAGSLAIATVATGLSIYAFVQQQAAEEGRRQVTETLAASDFRQGSALVAKTTSSPEGIAYLARSARNGNIEAETRLWTWLQQVNFWTPTAVGAAPKATPVPDTRVPYEIAQRFLKLDLNGKSVDLQSIAINSEGSRIFTSVNTDQPPPATLLTPFSDHLFRIWTVDGQPLSGWMPTPPLLVVARSYPTATFSPAGRYSRCRSICRVMTRSPCRCSTSKRREGRFASLSRCRVTCRCRCRWRFTISRTRPMP